MAKCPRCGKSVIADFNLGNWAAAGADLALNVGLEFIHAAIKGKPVRQSGPPTILFSKDLKRTYHCSNCGHVWKK